MSSITFPNGINAQKKERKTSVYKIVLFPQMSELAEEWGGHRRGKPAACKEPVFPSPKDLHVLNPKRLLNAGYAGKRNFKPK